MLVFLLITIALFCAVNGNLTARIPGGDIQTPADIKLLKQGPKGSKLYQIISPNSVYQENAPYIMDLAHSTSFDQGYDVGYLLGQAFIDNYQSLMKSLFGDEWWEPLVVKGLQVFLTWQWNSYLSKELPQEYFDEIKGLTAGGKAGKYSTDIGQIAAWGATLANFPGTMTNVKYILQDEKENGADGNTSSLESELAKEGISIEYFNEHIFNKIASSWSGLTCSMFGVWGSRTEESRLFTGRNLDWFKDSGISQNKLITVHHPPNGYAHATIGWAGIWGAITGISAEGVTAHEANLESNDISFRGFPWVLRLRHVMAYAKTLDEALQIWKNTNNTVGFNHGFGSAASKQAVVLETMKGNTAIFHDNDAREQDLVVNEMQIGQARPEAIYRTNHGYDSYTMEHYIESAGGYNNSITRYMIFPEMFDLYQQQAKKITYLEAVNITALVGDKGDSLYSCVPPYADASNILSVTYDPASLIAYTSFESGTKDTWTPAACGTYLKLDLKPFLLSTSFNKNIPQQ